MNAQKYVYFIRPVGMDGPIKIGSSNIPQDRLLTLSVWSPYPLEIIGAVPGTTRDEQFLHHSFADVHFHREWFHSSPKLRTAIAKIIEAGSVDAGRKFLKPLKTLRKSKRIVRAPEHQKFLDLQAAVRHAQKKLRKASPNGPYTPPEDVDQIVRRWNAQVYRGAGFVPLDAEVARVNEFLADPGKHAVFSPWILERRANPPVSGSAVPHLVEDAA